MADSQEGFVPASKDRVVDCHGEQQQDSVAPGECGENGVQSDNTTGYILGECGDIASCEGETELTVFTSQLPLHVSTDNYNGCSVDSSLVDSTTSPLNTVDSATDDSMHWVLYFCKIHTLRTRILLMMSLVQNCVFPLVINIAACSGLWTK